jgi:hypothetical protein
MGQRNPRMVERVSSFAIYSFLISIFFRQIPDLPRATAGVSRKPKKNYTNVKGRIMDPVARSAAQRIAQQARIAPPNANSLLSLSDNRDPQEVHEDNVDQPVDHEDNVDQLVDHEDIGFQRVDNDDEGAHPADDEDDRDQLDDEDEFAAQPVFLFFILSFILLMFHLVGRFYTR